MRRALGKIVLLLLLPIVAFAASVSVSVDKKEIVKGDTVTFTITAEGSKPKFPTVKSVGGFPILGTAQRTSISIVNGSVEKVYKKSYTFAPMQSVTIPSFKVEVDGKVYETKPLKVEVADSPAPSNGSGGDTSLTMKLNKKSAYVGEAVELEIVMRYRRDKNYIEAKVQKPEFANFWIKELGKPDEYDEGPYRVKRYRFLIFPQKAGEYRLGPLSAKFARRVVVKPPISNDPFFDDDFFNSMFARLEWTRALSNVLNLHVVPLPQGVQLYGEFDIEARVDKREVEANKPVELTIEIEGYGNIDDAPKFEPNIPDAVVYAEEPKVEAVMDGGRYGGRALQKITIVADRNFTIPSFTLEYFDAESKRVVKKRTKPIDISVKGAKAPHILADVEDEEQPNAKSETVGEKPEVHEAAHKTGYESGGYLLWLYIVISFIAGIVATICAIYAKRFIERKKSVRKDLPVADRVKRVKNDKELLEILLPYSDRSELLRKAVRDLEENLFAQGRNKIDKSRIIEELEDLDL
ncbi:MAG: BatD family protein [Hydrogenimonas sp.]|nr:BatD family protein [Hydrogenimonas sp.]